MNYETMYKFSHTVISAIHSMRLEDDHNHAMGHDFHRSTAYILLDNMEMIFTDEEREAVSYTIRLAIGHDLYEELNGAMATFFRGMKHTQADRKEDQMY